MTDIRLTRYSHGAGCACKLGPGELSQVLAAAKGHQAAKHPDLVVGFETSDDAGAIALGDGRVLVQTVDIFTPVVDSPYDWGMIAAANALSDIYAMGGSPLSAVQYLGWPRGELSFDLASEVITGGMDVMARAGCVVVGGHSIDSPEPTFGFAVTGLSHDGEVVSNAGGRPGDALVLTKPLGIGVATTAIKRGKCPPELALQAVEVMTTLNDAAGRALTPHQATAATDITGFGLLGHLGEMCHASGVGAEVRFDSVPVLDGVPELLAERMWAGGSQRNLDFILPRVRSERGLEELKLLADAQTSGGLLVALPSGSVEAYCSEVPGAVEIGRLTDGDAITVV